MDSPCYAEQVKCLCNEVSNVVKLSAAYQKALFWFTAFQIPDKPSCFSYLLDDGRGNPAIDNGYARGGEEVDDERLENLAYRLNRQQAPSYQTYKEFDPKRAYGFRSYDFGSKK